MDGIWSGSSSRPQRTGSELAPALGCTARPEAVAAAGLAYDLLLKEPQIRGTGDGRAAPGNALRHRSHRQAADSRACFEPWAALMRGFEPHRSHVCAKLSGMVTEADWRNWRPPDLAPYVREVLAIFGTERCLFGSDWPVCLVAADYADVKAALNPALAGYAAAAGNDLWRLGDRGLPAAGGGMISSALRALPLSEQLGLVPAGLAISTTSSRRGSRCGAGRVPCRRPALFRYVPFYGFGLSELRLGRFLRNLERNSFLISSKVGRYMVPPRGDPVDRLHWAGPSN